eukprot:810100-Prorocentrum_minimum.AAC.4
MAGAYSAFECDKPRPYHCACAALHCLATILCRGNTTACPRGPRPQLLNVVFAPRPPAPRGRVLFCSCSVSLKFAEVRRAAITALPSLSVAQVKRVKGEVERIRRASMEGARRASADGLGGPSFSELRDKIPPSPKPDLSVINPLCLEDKSSTRTSEAAAAEYGSTLSPMATGGVDVDATLSEEVPVQVERPDEVRGQTSGDIN